MGISTQLYLSLLLLFPAHFLRFTESVHSVVHICLSVQGLLLRLLHFIEDLNSTYFLYSDFFIERYYYVVLVGSLKEKVDGEESVE
jgi:hypothetical protein